MSKRKVEVCESSEGEVRVSVRGGNGIEFYISINHEGLVVETVAGDDMNLVASHDWNELDPKENV